MLPCPPNADGGADAEQAQRHVVAHERAHRGGVVGPREEPRHRGHERHADDLREERDAESIPAVAAKAHGVAAGRELRGEALYDERDAHREHEHRELVQGAVARGREGVGAERCDQHGIGEPHHGLRRAPEDHGPREREKVPRGGRLPGGFHRGRAP